MFEVDGSAAFATMGDLKNQARLTIEKAQERPVYLLRDGEPVGGIVSMAMMEILQEALEDRHMARIAAGRLEAVRNGEALLDEADFWSKAAAIMSKNDG